MRILACTFLIWITLAFPALVQNAQTGSPVINSPRPGDVLQGVITIAGSDDLVGFVSAEVSFTYADDPTGTWFLIASMNLPDTDGMLTTWDTTVITDGNYVLRLRVNLTDGSAQETTVPGLRVRNYTPVETPTPAALVATATFPTAIFLTAIPTATIIPTITITPTPFPTPTPMPNNPATLTFSDLYTSIFHGGMAVIISFILVGLYIWLRRK
jgi:hypothetical protein